ncbi:heavy metal-responsive transcriptional regulator [Mariprofundus micogutta]|nr:heavy metal-responsive transcriptional regulator [Mariprofundus micogutta]
MKIGELSKMTSVSIDTVRYYEQRGLIPRVARTQAGYRQYTSNDITRLKFIVQAKELGFTLDEIGQLLSISTDGRSCGQIKAVAEGKADEIKMRIQKLSHMRQILLTLAEQCEQTSDADTCPILKVLEDVQ